MPHRSGSFRRDIGENIPLEPVRKAAGQLTRAFKNQTRAACFRKADVTAPPGRECPELGAHHQSLGKSQIVVAERNFRCFEKQESRSMTAYFKAHDHRVRRQRRRPYAPRES